MIIQSKIFFIKKRVKQPKLRVFCFPYAGGSINTYFSWPDIFPNDIEVVLVQSAGRGSRLMEAPHREMEVVIYELIKEMDDLVDIPFVVFGHSLGSRVAYALCCQLDINGLPLPKLFIGSGSRAPHLAVDKKPIYHLPKSEFVEELRNLNGTPEAILADEEFMNLLMPALRADFQIADTWQSNRRTMPFPIVVLHGLDDIDIPQESLNAWQELTNQSCEIIHLPGDHFFIEQHNEKVVETILPYLKEVSA